MKRALAILMIALSALGATACATDGGVAAARVQQDMYSNGGPN